MGFFVPGFTELIDEWRDGRDCLQYVSQRDKVHIVLGSTRGVVEATGTDPCTHEDAVEAQNR